MQETEESRRGAGGGLNKRTPRVHVAKNLEERNTHPEVKHKQTTSTLKRCGQEPSVWGFDGGEPRVQLLPQLRCGEACFYQPEKANMMKIQ